MPKKIVFGLLAFFMILSACATSSPTPFSITPGNIEEYLAPTYTPRPIPTPFPKRESGEIVLLLRKRTPPFETLILRLSDDCLASGKGCDLGGNLLGVLPQSLSQIQRISWMQDGSKAFFWDGNTADIYALDANQGTFQVFKKEVLKTQENFLISPDGKTMIFEVQKNDQETDLVLMNTFSGNIVKLDLSIIGAKHPSQWLSENVILFWNEISEGKGYLVDLKVYTLDVTDQRVQPFDIGRDWLKTSVPIFSPDREWMAFTSENQTIIRNISSAQENVLDVQSEKLLWSPDSTLLAICDPNMGIYTMFPGENNLQEIYPLSSIGILEDWIWLPDGKNIMLIIGDENGNKQIRILSIVSKTLTSVNFSLLNDYDPVSFSLRP